MSVVVATHSGPFHADDVLAWALVRQFYAAEARIVRTRDKAELAEADIVFDVGGVFDPSQLRFDHHQSSYAGPLSSAGMVLNWLDSSKRLPSDLAEKLRIELVNYVDEVDNGRIAPKENIPCFPKLVEALNQTARTEAEFDEAFVQAGELALAFVRGIVAGYRQVLEASRVVVRAMKKAEESRCNVIFFEEYYRWKDIYFDHGGEQHPTDFVLFPGTDGTWRLVAIPPVRGSFDQKTSLPQAWAGLSDAALEEITGTKGSLFCHKNRFIAVFSTKDVALRVMKGAGLLRTGDAG